MVMRCPAGASRCHGCLLEPQRVDDCAVMWTGSDVDTDTVHERSSSTTVRNVRIISVICVLHDETV